MELEQARKRAAELRAVIEKNNRLYYDQDAPELEDYEYDQLTRELKTIEAQFPQLVTPDSPTQHVGGTPSGKFSKVAHAVKMESLQDAFSLDELREFDQRVREAGVTPEYVVEIKIDGLSVSLEYRNGRLTVEKIGDISTVGCWNEGVIDVSSMPFDELMRKFEKAYNVNIEILRDSLPVVTYTRGKIRVTDGIEHAMSVLRLASDFEYEYDIETATVYVR